MIGTQRGQVASEQLLVLWTLLLKGYVPVAHIVADLDEPETFASSEPADAASAHGSHPRARLAYKVAA